MHLLISLWLCEQPLVTNLLRYQSLACCSYFFSKRFEVQHAHKMQEFIAHWLPDAMLTLVPHFACQASGNETVLTLQCAQ